MNCSEKDKVKSGSGNHTVNYSGGERAGRGIAIVVHKSITRSAVNKNVCKDRQNHCSQV
jgi:hypothetical protein